MQNEETAMIPFFAHESAVNRLERMNKRLLILLLSSLRKSMIFPSDTRRP